MLESLAACHNSNAKLIMYFTVNLAFTNYIDQFNITEELEVPILTNKTTSEFTLPIFLNKTTIDDTLLSAPLTLKEYIHQYKHDSEISDLKERHDLDEREKEYANKNFFNIQVIKIFEFIVAIISIIATLITIYAICKHNKLRAFVKSLALQQVEDVEAKGIGNEKCNCTAQFYIILILILKLAEMRLDEKSKIN